MAGHRRKRWVSGRRTRGLTGGRAFHPFRTRSVQGYCVPARSTGTRSRAMLKSHRPRRDREMLTLIGVFTRVESAARTLRTPKAGFAHSSFHLANQIPARGQGGEDLDHPTAPTHPNPRTSRPHLSSLSFIKNLEYSGLPNKIEDGAGVGPVDPNAPCRFQPSYRFQSRPCCLRRTGSCLRSGSRRFRGW